MPGDLKIDPPDGREERTKLSPHLWWSRLLYAVYGLASAAAAVAALLHDRTQLAIVAGGVALVLLWKAAQRAR